MAKLLLGKEVNEKLNKELINQVNDLKGRGINPMLAIMRVGENPSDMAYERGALKRADTIGVFAKQFTYNEKITTEEFLQEIHNINEDKNIHGVLILRPLPKHIDDDAVRNALDPKKDMDGIGDMSMAGVYGGKPIGYPPCTAEAAIRILNHYDINLCGKRVVVIGRSLVIGRPVSMMLMKENATVTICHTKTIDMDKIAQAADIIIAAAGVRSNVGENFVRPGQVIIDVGINFTHEGKMCGDVDFDAVSHKVSAITPVPGGVGAVTTSILMSHVIEAAKLV
ncbi:MAG: bifunctional 5,10-methylenetetrahydrofolate dehydrogenase/5,10-methenyltetrahydrofolate cyclohydrolase [Anaerovoracaceae bacterium]